MTADSNPPSLIAATESELLPRIPSSQGGPGRVIRAARERAQMTVEELATQTKLTRVTLEALERDDFEALNEPLYVRGYYRKCAKVLALSEAELIAGYERLVVPKAPQAPTKLLLGSGPAMGSTRIRRRGDGSRLVGAIVIAVALGGVVWLVTGGSANLRSLESSATTTVSTPAVAVAPAETAPSPSPASTEAAVSTHPFAASAPATTPAAEPATPLAAPAASLATPAASPVTTPSAVAPAPAPTPAPAPSPAPAVSASASTTAAAPSAPTPASPAPVSASAPAVASAGGYVVLNFKSTSWVRVEDADGKLLLSGVVQAGDRQQVRGRAPYALFIGNAPGVAVEYDGKPVDTAPYVKSNSTARFSIP